MACETSAANDTTSTLTMLECVRKLVEAERGLTKALERSRPLLQSQNRDGDEIDSGTSASASPQPPLLPTPKDMDAVRTVLALARTLSSRTSAPPSWDSTMPVVTFATPNPLPHQLRGGSLGAMQLKMARDERKQRNKRRLEEEQQEEERRRADEAAAAEEAAKGEAEGVGTKRARGEEGADQLREKQRRHHERNRREEAARLNKAAEARPVANMNLSDTSSSEEDDDEDEEESE